MKSIFTSKTFWFNVAAGLVWVLMGLFPTLPLSPELVAGLQTGGNVILRFLTSQGVTFAPPKIEA